MGVCVGVVFFFFFFFFFFFLVVVCVFCLFCCYQSKSSETRPQWPCCCFCFSAVGALHPHPHSSSPPPTTTPPPPPPPRAPHTCVDLGAGVAIAQLLNRSNIVLLVGGGDNPLDAPNRICVWDDIKGKIVHKIQLSKPVVNLVVKRERSVKNSHTPCAPAPLPACPSVSLAPCLPAFACWYATKTPPFSYTHAPFANPQIDCGRRR